MLGLSCINCIPALVLGALHSSLHCPAKLRPFKSEPPLRSFAPHALDWRGPIDCMPAGVKDKGLDVLKQEAGLVPNLARLVLTDTG